MKRTRLQCKHMHAAIDEIARDHGIGRAPAKEQLYAHFAAAVEYPVPSSSRDWDTRINADFVDFCYSVVAHAQQK